MLVDTPVKEITVDDKTYRYYLGTTYVSIEVDSIMFPKSGKVYFSNQMPAKEVGEAIAKKEGLRYQERVDTETHTIIRRILI